MKRVDFFRRLVSGAIGIPFLGLRNPLERAPEAIEDSTLGPGESEGDDFAGWLWPNESPFPCRWPDEACLPIDTLSTPQDCLECRHGHNYFIVDSDPEWYEEVVIDPITGMWTDPDHTAPTGFNYGDTP